LGDLLVHVKLTLLKGFVRFFKPNHNSNLQEGNWIVKLEFFGSEGYVLSYKLCRNGEGVLVWVFASVDDIQFRLTTIEPWH
jgi:hypothetical protein